MTFDTALALGATALVLAASFAASRRAATPDGFFRGTGVDGRAPGLGTLVLSQVTTWIFARSLLTAAVLAFHYGVAGALAYTAYYLSFFTGGLVIDRLRAAEGSGSIHEFLRARFGAAGTTCFNIVVAARLLSEVFANLLVVGLVFGGTGSLGYWGAITAISVLTLAYSMMGGLSASLRTDVVQMLVFLGLLAAVWLAVAALPQVNAGDLATPARIDQGPGWVLLVVALLQVISYPLHDPVMTDRGFIADRETTRRSFWLAGLLGMGSIFAFAMLGVVAAHHAGGATDFQQALAGLLGAPLMVLVNLALIVSAVSTMDSTLSSAAKLAVVDMGLARATLANGRVAMASCMAGGLGFLALGWDELYTAVAVSGTASMFLAPVAVVSILGRREVARWAYLAAFLAAVAGAAAYGVESEGGMRIVGDLTGLEHKYSKLLAICVAVLAVGFGAFALGLKRR
ncbi:sodium:proline symporter [Limibaculum sp. M0105]|uniref:Sodium:proline symporter n=1 Tax=Thermohalobaculum xanthum TaxID=2753746 RepID=A0A8J7M4F8_9RHOB|nr:sodium:proline symporter [Thermohalobaculum xanthum]MBK0397935.1 sodium:proline symporter [Thermohalobaculum xanthum]